MKVYHHSFLSAQDLIQEATVIIFYIILFTTIYGNIFTARIVSIWNSLPNSVVDANSVNAFNARLDKFWMHQEVMSDFTADLCGTETDQYCHEVFIT